jgi:hypothetical protein
MKAHQFSLALSALAIVTSTAAQASSLVDIPKIAGRSIKQVDDLLKAKPTCAKNKRGTKCDYNEGRIEIIFINGKADWITVNGLDQVPFTDAGIARLGFSEKSPTFRSPVVMRWNGLPSVLEVSMFKGQTGTDYAYIKVNTP